MKKSQLDRRVGCIIWGSLTSANLENRAMIKYLTSLMVALAMVLGIPALAIAAAGGVGVGVTVGTYSASAQSGGALGNLIVGGQIGTFSQSAGTHSYASAGMAIGVD